jgi:hypothetical protein
MIAIFISSGNMISAVDPGGQQWFRAGQDPTYFQPDTYLPNGQPIDIFIPDFSTPEIVNTLPGGRLVLSTGQLLVPAPEPGTIALMLVGGILIALFRKRSRVTA